MIKLMTQRIILRDHVPGDLATHHALMSNPEVMYYLQDIMTHSMAESEENLRTAIEESTSDKRTFYFLRMEERETGEHIGEMGYTVTDVTPCGKMVHLGYFTHRKFWGHGFATEALHALVEFAFRENDVFRITTGCIKDNRGSERVMQKNGFTKEGDFLKYEFHDGVFKDRLQYHLLRTEWEAAQNNG